jgi:hypothetical protein
MVVWQRVNELEEENARLRAEVEKLEAIICQDTCCAYCGQAYPQGTPRFGSEALTEHIKVCPEHPMRKAETRIERLEEAVEAALQFLQEMCCYLDGEPAAWAQMVYDLLKEEVT